MLRHGLVGVGHDEVLYAVGRLDDLTIVLACWHDVGEKRHEENERTEHDIDVRHLEALLLRGLLLQVFGFGHDGCPLFVCLFWLVARASKSRLPDFSGRTAKDLPARPAGARKGVPVRSVHADDGGEKRHAKRNGEADRAEVELVLGVVDAEVELTGIARQGVMHAHGLARLRLDVPEHVK